MSRFDVLRSFVRTAGQQLDGRALRARLGRALGNSTLARLDVADAELTAAVARGTSIEAATVASGAGSVRVDLGLHDGASLAFALVPQGVQFAPGGAKEIAFRVTPASAADAGAAREAFAGIVGAVARTLWRPALGGQVDSGTDAQSAFVTREGDRLVLDMRTVPSIRTASQNRLGIAMIETMVLKSIEVRGGGLRLAVGLRGLG